MWASSATHYTHIKQESVCESPLLCVVGGTFLYFHPHPSLSHMLFVPISFLYVPMIGIWLGFLGCLTLHCQSANELRVGLPFPTANIQYLALGCQEGRAFWRRFNTSNAVGADQRVCPQHRINPRILGDTPRLSLQLITRTSFNTFFSQVCKDNSLQGARLKA